MLISGVSAFQIGHANGEGDPSSSSNVQVCPSLVYLNLLSQKEALSGGIHWSDRDKAILAHIESVIECRENEEEDDETHSFGSKHGQRITSLFSDLLAGDFLSRLPITECNPHFLPSARYLLLQVIRI